MMNEPRRRPNKQPDGSAFSVQPGGDDLSNNPKKKKKKRKRSKQDDQPFYVLFLQTGVCVTITFLFCWRIFRFFVPFVPPVIEIDDDNKASEAFGNEAQEIPIIVDVKEQVVEYVPPPLPTFNLSLRAQFDAFALSSLEHKNENKKTESIESFWRESEKLRNEFSDYYGGEGRALIDLGLSTFGLTVNGGPSKQQYIPSDLNHTACRILSARAEKRPFRFTFGGYSVTAGRGNYFHQSFPFFMERKLKTVFSLLDVPLEVKNAAIGGCPSFPYGWCLKNFWGEDTDVVSWDFSMNEAGGDPLGFEAYVRHILQFPRRPKLIVKDTIMAEQRRHVLAYYLEKGSLKDPVVLHLEPATEPFLSRFDRDLPLGFREWRKFGAPNGAPGQALHHPAVKEHEFLGWLLTMHFLAALELAAASLNDADINLQCGTEDGNLDLSNIAMPKPLAYNANVTSRSPWASIFYGEADDSNSDDWKMRPVYCRTSFEPVVSGNDLVQSAVLGAVGTDLDIMLPKSKMFYNQGWVLDLSDSEKKAKRMLGLYDGLGFMDSKKAFYGILMSGQLKLLLPYERAQSSGSAKSPKPGEKAISWFRSVVICKVNEKRDVDVCDVSKDMDFKVGGVNATAIAQAVDAPGAMYLGRKICVYIPVPPEAVLTTPKIIKAKDEVSLTKNVILPPDTIKDIDWENHVGLEVGVSVRNALVVQISEACSVSHAIWEQQMVT